MAELLNPAVHATAFDVAYIGWVYAMIACYVCLAVTGGKSITYITYICVTQLAIGLSVFRSMWINQTVFNSVFHVLRVGYVFEIFKPVVQLVTILVVDGVAALDRIVSSSVPHDAIGKASEVAVTGGEAYSCISAAVSHIAVFRWMHKLWIRCAPNGFRIRSFCFDFARCKINHEALFCNGLLDIPCCGCCYHDQSFHWRQHIMGEQKGQYYGRV